MKHGTRCYCVFCDFVVPVLIGIVIVFIIGLGIGSVAAHLQFQAQIHQVEQVRASLQSVDPGDRAELINTAVGWNTRIVSCRYWNTRWYADFLSPDGCNDLELIDVSK